MEESRVRKFNICLQRNTAIRNEQFDFANCKLVVFRYHEYKIKLPVGSKVDVQREVGGVDDRALVVTVPNDLPEDILKQRMTSKSSRSSYIVRDVVGKVMGRVQYFLNKTFVDLLDEGKVSQIEGYVCLV